jgi:hypothetical protein
MARDNTGTGRAVGVSAFVLGLLGIAFLFAGRDVGGLAGAGGEVEPVASLLGAALLGFGAMNWIARGSILGGIYGRAVVVANQVHFSVGALVLLKRGIVTGGSGMVWALAFVYLLGAALFAYLLRGPGLRPASGGTGAQ